MIGKLKALFTGGSGDGEAPVDGLQMATAVLMVEAAMMDGEFTDDERVSVDAIMQRHFGLSPQESAELIALAEAEQEEAGHLFRYTTAIKDALGEQARLEVVELLWEVVYADGKSHAYEASLLRRIAGLLYVSDRDRGEARKRVLARMGVTE